MLFGAFRPQTIRKIKKLTSSAQRPTAKPKKYSPPATRNARNLDLYVVQIPSTAHPTAAPNGHCHVFLRGRNSHASTDPARRSQNRTTRYLRPPSARLSALSALSAHVFPKTFSSRRSAHLRTTAAPHVTTVLLSNPSRPNLGPVGHLKSGYPPGICPERRTPTQNERLLKR
jgi:hypothetical protein